MMRRLIPLGEKTSTKTSLCRGEAGPANLPLITIFLELPTSSNQNILASPVNDPTNDPTNAKLIHNERKTNTQRMSSNDEQIHNKYTTNAQPTNNHGPIHNGHAWRPSRLKERFRLVQAFNPMPLTPCLYRF